MITYVNVYENDTLKFVRVRLDNKVVGRIKHTNEGYWQYFPNKQKVGGDLFETLSACKRSLEG